MMRDQQLATPSSVLCHATTERLQVQGRPSGSAPDSATSATPRGLPRSSAGSCSKETSDLAAMLSTNSASRVITLGMASLRTTHSVSTRPQNKDIGTSTPSTPEPSCLPTVGPLFQHCKQLGGRRAAAHRSRAVCRDVQGARQLQGENASIDGMAFQNQVPDSRILSRPPAPSAHRP